MITNKHPDREAIDAGLIANFIISFFLVLSSMGPAVISVVAKKQIALDYDVSVSVVSLLYAAFFVMVGLGSYACGKLFDETSYKRLFLWSGLSNVIIGVACYYSVNAILFFLLLGIALPLFGSAAFLGPLAALAGTWLPKHQAIAVAIPTLGQLVAFWLWSFLLDLLEPRLGWRGLLLVIATAGVVQLTLTHLIVRRKPNGLIPRLSLPATEKILPIELIVGACFLTFFGATLSLTTLPSMPSVAAGGGTTVLGAFSCLAIIGRLLYSILFDKGFVSISVVTSLAAIFVANIILSLNNNSYYLTIFGAGVLGFGYSGFLPVIMAFSRANCIGPAPENANRIILFGTVGIAVGSLTGGLSSDMDGQAIASMVAMAACLISLAIMSVCCARIRKVVR